MTDLANPYGERLPCEKSGKHEVVGIKPISGSDSMTLNLLNQGYRFRGLCRLCQGSIIGKTEEELKEHIK